MGRAYLGPLLADASFSKSVLSIAGTSWLPLAEAATAATAATTDAADPTVIKHSIFLAGRGELSFTTRALQRKHHYHSQLQTKLSLILVPMSLPHRW